MYFLISSNNKRRMLDEERDEEKRFLEEDKKENNIFVSSLVLNVMWKGSGCKWWTGLRVISPISKAREKETWSTRNIHSLIHSFQSNYNNSNYNQRANEPNQQQQQPTFNLTSNIHQQFIIY